MGRRCHIRLIFLITALVAAEYVASQHIHITPNDMEPVREEMSKYGVTCYGPSSSEFNWRGPKGPISHSPQFRVHSQDLNMSNNQTGLLLVFERVMEEDEGNYTCTDRRRGHNVVIKLTVTKVLEFDAPPNQTTDEYADYLIKCKVKGNIKPTFMWYFQNRTFKEKTTNGKYSVQDGGLLVRNVSHLDAGKYGCRAFETTSDYTVSEDRDINLIVRHKPTFLHYMEGEIINQYVYYLESANLSCQNSAEPPANVSWSFEHKPFLYPYDHYIVTFNKQEKLGRYKCTVSNPLGTITRQYQLMEGFKPQIPRGLTVVSTGDNYIELAASPNEKSDALIGYRVEYIEKLVKPNSLTYESYNMKNFNSTEGPFALDNLKPNTEYIIKISARNMAGVSDFSDPLTARTLPVNINGVQSYHGSLLVAALTAIMTIAQTARL